MYLFYGYDLGHNNKAAGLFYFFALIKISYSMLKTYLKIFFFAFPLVLIGFLSFPDGRAEALLKPEEIVVVVNSGSADSVRIGELYLKLREVPADHLVKLDVTKDEHISRRRYVQNLALPLKRAIKRLIEKGRKIRCIVTVYGIPLVVSHIRPSDTSDDEINKYRERILWKKEEIARIAEKMKKKDSSSKPSKELLAKLKNEKNELKFELDHLLGYDTSAAVDSELALLLSSEYPLASAIPNPEFIHQRGKINNPPKVLMVSRLDAPTPVIAEGLIRTAIEVEKSGLSGKFYLDARGITKDDDYGMVDKDIRKTAQLMKRSSMPVVLDNQPGLFKAGEAPSAALYCGWYSLAKYRDAFQWAKGAVGYHIASAEARSLHDKKAKYWVKSMLERGVIGTLGPVGEPYLRAFPLPSIFFQLLMSGQYTLAEVFAMSNPFLSWRMILIGDPLYNPFKAKPAYPLINPPPPPE